MNIIICTSCQGEGSVKVYDFRDWEYHKCKNCNGTGRLRTLRYECSVPFDYEAYYKIDEKVVGLLRGLEASSRSNILKN